MTYLKKELQYGLLSMQVNILVDIFNMPQNSVSRSNAIYQHTKCIWAMHKLTHIKMHRRVYGRNGDVVILLCVTPPQYPSTALNQIIIYKVFIIQICILIFLKSLQSLFFAEFPTNGFFAPFLLKKKECRKITSKPKIHQIFIESRNYIGQGRNQKLFQQVKESFIPSHYAIIHLCLLPYSS